MGPVMSSLRGCGKLAFQRVLRFMGSSSGAAHSRFGRHRPLIVRADGCDFPPAVRSTRGAAGPAPAAAASIADCVAFAEIADYWCRFDPADDDVFHEGSA